MSSFTIHMMAGSLPPVKGSNGSNDKGPAAASVRRATLPLQVRVKGVQKLEAAEKTSTNVSRRELALFLTAASLSAATLSSPKPAEAGVSRREMKKLILEKLKKLREKIGLSKPEPEETEKTGSPKPAPAPPKAEKQIPVPPEPPLPHLQNDKKIVVEATTLP